MLQLTPQMRILVAVEPVAFQIYELSGEGRHLRTLDALTGAVIYGFSPADGPLEAIADRAGNVTAIERLGGVPAAIVAPGGQRTELSLTPGGYVESIENPADETVQASYAGEGLLRTFTDPRGAGTTYTFTYDDLGRLTLDEDPEGGSKALARTLIAPTTANEYAFQVDVETGMGRLYEFLVEKKRGGATRRLNTAPDGTQTEVVKQATDVETTVSPDGTWTIVTMGPEQGRFGLQAPVSKRMEVSTPGMRVAVPAQAAVLEQSRVVTLASPPDPREVTSVVETIAFNGRTMTRSYVDATRTITEESAAGRERTIVLDEKGRVTQVGVIGIHPTELVYDSLGRLESIRQGPAGGGTPERIYTVGYDPMQPQNRITAIENPESEVTSFAYDAADRVTVQTLPDLEVIGFGYDATGNLDALTPPGRTAHDFLFSGVNLATQYAPPNVTPPLAAPETDYVYNLDRQLERVKLPRETGTEPPAEYEMELAYEAGTDRLERLTLPDGQGEVVYTYDPATGQIATITGPDPVDPVVLSYGYDGFLETSVTWSCVSPPCPAGTVEGTVSREYDPSFRLVSEKVNGAHEATFEYDADDLLEEITVAGQTMTLTRDPQRGGLITATAVGDITDTREYNDFGEIERYEASYQGVPFYGYEIDEADRDGLGRILKKTETIGGVTTVYEYSYDARGRLDTVTKDGVVVSDYGYDPNGNRLTHHGPGSTLLAEGTYDAQDRLESYGLATYTYNPSGQLATKLEGSALTRSEASATPPCRTPRSSST